MDLSKKGLDVLKYLIQGKALAISKKETKAELVFADYSFFKRIDHFVFDELKEKKFITKIDSRISSTFYSINEKGIARLNI